jgi:heme ABC exporter ATP-binding subunit CcmA
VSAVETRGLEKRFERVRALRGLDLDIPAGAALWVAGPNGAGKSTLLRVLAGLMRPTRGEVRVLGETLYAAAGRRVRGRVAFLGAQAGLYPELSVRENLRFCARLNGLPPVAGERSLDHLALRERAEEPVRTLSFGFRRRAGLARALLGEPDLVLLDEPWNGLDADACTRLETVLGERRASGGGPTLLIAAHQSERGQALYDDTLTLEQGAWQA